MKGIGIIGCGHWGKNYLRVFREIGEDCELSICDSNSISLSSAIKMNPRVKSFKDVEDIFSDRNISAVVVSTPAATHYELVKKALSRGKHVLVEKPFTLKSGQAKELIDLAANTGLVLMVSHTFLYNPAIRLIKQYISKGTCGKIYYLKSVRTHLGLIREDVNVFWDLAAHDIAIFGYLLEAMPKSVSATGSQIIKEGREDVGFAVLNYPGNIIANIHVSWIDSHKERELSIVGSKERIVFDDLDNLEKVKIFEKGLEVERDISNFGEFQLLLRDGNIISPKVDAYEPLRKECEHFIECVDKGGRPLTDGKNGWEVVRVLEAFQESLAKKGAPVEI
jgi:predicted dehydrogenase